MPRNRKPPGTAVDRRNGQQANLSVVAGDAEVVRVPMPDGLLKETQEQWDAYWADPVASVQTLVDRSLLLRWIKNLDRYERLIAEADRSPLVEGLHAVSAHPLYAVASKIEASVKADEAQLGIGPLNRSKLGIAVISERRSLADMNARYSEPEGSTDDGEDPRLAIIDGEVV